MSLLPPGWNSTWDGERWYFIHTSTGKMRDRFPEPGDELLDLPRKPPDLPTPTGLAGHLQQLRHQRSREAHSPNRNYSPQRQSPLRQNSQMADRESMTPQAPESSHNKAIDNPQLQHVKSGQYAQQQQHQEQKQKKSSKSAKSPKAESSVSKEGMFRTWAKKFKNSFKKSPKARPKAMSLSDVDLVDGELPHMEMPHASLPGMSMPNASMPNISTPSASLPNMTLSNASMPDVSLPSASRPEPRTPKLRVEIPQSTPAHSQYTHRPQQQQHQVSQSHPTLSKQPPPMQRQSSLPQNSHSSQTRSPSDIHRQNSMPLLSNQSPNQFPQQAPIRPPRPDELPLLDSPPRTPEQSPLLPQAYFTQQPPSHSSPRESSPLPDQSPLRNRQPTPDYFPPQSTSSPTPYPYLERIAQRSPHNSWRKAIHQEHMQFRPYTPATAAKLIEIGSRQYQQQQEEQQSHTPVSAVENSHLPSDHLVPQPRIDHDDTDADWEADVDLTDLYMQQSPQQVPDTPPAFFSELYAHKSQIFIDDPRRANQRGVNAYNQQIPWTHQPYDAAPPEELQPAKPPSNVAESVTISSNLADSAYFSRHPSSQYTAQDVPYSPAHDRPQDMVLDERQNQSKEPVQRDQRPPQLPRDILRFPSVAAAQSPSGDRRPRSSHDEAQAHNRSHDHSPDPDQHPEALALTPEPPELPELVPDLPQPRREKSAADPATLGMDREAGAVVGRDVGLGLGLEEPEAPAPAPTPARPQPRREKTVGELLTRGAGRGLGLAVLGGGPRAGLREGVVWRHSEASFGPVLRGRDAN